MARKLLVEILADASGFVNGLKTSSRASETFSADLRKLSIDAKASAEAQVAASTRKTERLRTEVAAYHEIAAASRRGSSEQVAAANLASQAESRLAASLGVTAHEARVLRASSSGLERDIGRATRGALAGSGIFRGLGRSIAFASGGFLAFATGGQFIRTSIDAAKEAQVTQKQLAAQFRASGKDVQNFQGEIDATANHLGLLAGFTNDEVKAGFTTIFRTTGNVAKALRDEATAADLARAKHIELAQASLIVAKTEAGNTTLLRRQGFEIAKHATAEEALAKLRQIVAGQARAGTTQQERFGAVLHNTEEIIGAGVLPTLNRYLAEGARWLTQMNESGRLQKDVNRIVGGTAAILRDAGAVVKVAAAAFGDLNSVTGSAEHTLKLFAETWLLLKARTALIGWGVIESGIVGVGTQAAVASGEVTGLTASLTKLKGLGPIAVAVALSLVPKAKADANPTAPSRNPVAKFFAGLPVVGGVFSQANRLADRLGRAEGLLPSVGAGSPAFHGRPTFPLEPFNPRAHTAVRPATNDRSRPISLQGQFNLAELRLADAERANNTKLQHQILVSEETIVLKLRDQAKTLKDRTAFAQQAAQIENTIRGIDQQDAQAKATEARKQAEAVRRRKVAADAAERKQKAAEDKADKAAQAAALKVALGGVPLSLQLAQAKADAIAAATGSSDLSKSQIRVAEEIRAAEYKAIRSHKLNMQGLIDAWNQIAQVNQQLVGQGKHLADTYHYASTRALTVGLGLAHDQAAAIRSRAAQIDAHGGRVPNGPAANGIVITGALHFHNVQNHRQLVQELQRIARSGAAQRRGRHDGATLGLK